MSEGVEHSPSGVRRMVNILAAVLVGVVLPVVIVGALVGHFGASAMFTGLLWGVLGTKLGGTRRMLYLAPVVGIEAGLGAGTAYDWWWVALLTVLGVVAGGGIRFGWFPPLLMPLFAAMFVTPLSSAENAVIIGVISAIGALYGVVLARRFGAPQVVEGERQPLRQAVAVAVVFGVVLGGAAAIGVASGWSEPYWVPEPILILTLYVLLGKRERIQEKAIGTAVGASAAIVVAILAPPPEVIGAIALVAFLLALTQLKTYWLYYSLYTFALVLAPSRTRTGRLRGEGTRLRDPNWYRPARGCAGDPSSTRVTAIEGRSTTRTRSNTPGIGWRCRSTSTRRPTEVGSTTGPRPRIGACIVS